jgi:hypothetical protein
MKKKPEISFLNKENEEPLLEQDQKIIKKMKSKTEEFLNYEIKELHPQNQQEAKIYLSLIRNIHSKKIKGKINKIIHMSSVQWKRS